MTWTDKALRAGLDTGCRGLNIRCAPDPQLNVRTSIRAAAAVLCIALTGCAQPAVQVQADQSAICDALRPAMPIQYHGATTDAETKANIQQANARYQAACK